MELKIMKMSNEMIEFWEHQYLEQIYYLLSIDKKKMIDGFNTKEDIKNDWIEFLGKETSDFATGSERIFYWLFNQFGIPNSSPIGSDMFFETYNAYVHIDIKTVTTKNIGDFKRNIFVSANQTSYIGEIKTKTYTIPYKGHLPTFYNKSDGRKKVCLTYFICILYNADDLSIQSIIITCMPNGELSEIYEPLKTLNAGKNPDGNKVRYNFTNCKYFELLEDKPLRTKVLIWNPSEENETKLKEIQEIYEEQNMKKEYI